MNNKKKMKLKIIELNTIPKKYPKYIHILLKKNNKEGLINEIRKIMINKDINIEEIIFLSVKKK